MINTNTTLGFTATFGVNKGYHHNNNVFSDLTVFGNLWQRVMQEKFDSDKILIGCVIHDSKTVYPIGFGCPPGGENTVTVSGQYNPEFLPKLDAGYAFLKREICLNVQLDQLKKVTIDICEKMKELLDQATVSIAFYKVDDFVYLSSKEQKG